MALFALLLNYPWEFLQVPLYAAMPELPHWQAVKQCSAAALGDAIIAVAAYAAAGAASRSRHWLLRPPALAWAVYLGTGLAVTVAVEWLATEVLGRWRYGPAMPTLPGFGTGIAPLLQWLVLPPLVVLLARGQIRGRRSTV